MAKVNPPVILVANTSWVGNVDGITYSLNKGDLVEADSPVVRQWPDFFGPVQFRYPVEREPAVPVEPPIEQATAAPGEKRGRYGR